MEATLNRRAGSVLLALCAVFPLWSSLALGQTQTAQLTGTIMDPVGAVVPDAMITVTNVATQVIRTTRSNSNGSYLLSSLQPGSYRVEVAKEGFQKAAFASFSLDVNQAATLDIRLKIGEITEIVQVVAEATLLEGTTAQLGTVITQEKIHDLPLNARNFSQLLTLTPGATPVSVAQNAGGDYVQKIGTFVFPAVHGQSNRSNTFTLDGVYNNAHWYNTYAIAPNLDALDQFKVQAHSDQAEFGGVTGGVVNIASRSGTNQYHGTLYEFLRNDALDARGFFAARKPPLRQNQFGATLGGPIRRDKTFFLFAYEGYRQVNSSSALYVVPTPEQLRGDFSTLGRQLYNPFTTRPDPANPNVFLRDPFPNNRIPVELINPSTRAWAEAIVPKPIDTGNPAFNGRNTTSQKFPANQFSIRVDHNFSPSDFVWARYTWGEQNQQSAGLLSGTTTKIDLPVKNAGLNYSHVFGASSVFNALFGYSGVRQNSVRSISGRNFISEGLFVGFPETHGLIVPGMILPSAFGTQGSRIEFLGLEAYQSKSDLSHVRGRHTLKFGGEFISMLVPYDTYEWDLGFNSLQTADLRNPGNTGFDIASFVLGVFDSYEFRNRESYYETQLWNLYFQDSWKAIDRLTMNFGLRWDLLRNPAFSKNFPSTWDFNSGKFIVGELRPPACGPDRLAPCLPDPGHPYLQQYVSFTGSPRLRQDDYRMFGPRFGFAYRLGSTKVIRGGFGVFYDLQAGTTQQGQNAGGAWPNVGRARGMNINRPFVQVLAQNPFGARDPRIPEPTPENASAFFYDPLFQNPYSLQWNLEIQNELWSKVNLTIGYVGSGNSRLPIGGSYNTALEPGQGPIRPRALWPRAPVTTYDRSVGRSNYNGLQVKAEQRLADGLSYLVAYTWSKSIDIASSGQFGVESLSLQDPYHPNRDRSVSGYDIPHNFSAAAMYQLPFGYGRRWLPSGLGSRVLGNWQLNAIVLLRSGQPYTPTMNVDVANIGAITTRPNLLGNPHLDDPKPEMWFNKSSYASPQVFQFGTAGRNQLRTDGFQNLDLSLFREDSLSERLKMQFRVETFNVFNHATFGIPVTAFTNPRFGQVSSTVSTARQIQLGLKFIF